MDRKIVVDVNGSYLRKDNKIAGVQGEGNSTYLNLIFDEGWNGLAKKITFWNSKGMNPVEITLTTDHLTNMSTSLLDYTVSIPPEPLEFDGEMEYVIDGYKDGVRVRSLADKMVVKYAPTANNAGSPADPTPTQAEQLQKQIDTMLGDMQTERIKAETAASTSQQAAETSVLAKGSAESAAQTATIKAGEASDSASAAKTSEENAKQSETNAKASEESAAKDAQTAANKALEAKQALEEAITAKNSAESAKTVAEAARDDAVAAKTSAETARNESVSAKDESVSAKEYSVAAKEAAEAAQSVAETARDESVSAKTSAETAQSAAETAREEAVTAKTAAETAKTAAETAKNESISAKEDAVAAKTAAETARDQAQEIAGGDFATKTEFNEHVTNLGIHVTADEKAVWNEKANKSTISTSTMSASGWSAGVYSFESTYPVATYDIEVALDSTATAEQAEAFNAAQIVGSATSNVVKAYGIVPTVDIPICIKAVMK